MLLLLLIALLAPLAHATQPHLFDVDSVVAVAAAAAAKTKYPTTYPTRYPTKAPTTFCTPADYLFPIDKELCKPGYGTNKFQCDDTLRRCYCQLGIPMKWVGKGCSQGGDGGCQCLQSCGYKCSSKCNADDQCEWLTGGVGCANKYSGRRGNLPLCERITHMPTKSPTTSRPSKAPTTSRPSTSPTLRPTTAAPTPRPSKAPTTSRPSTSPTMRPTTAAPTPRPSTAPTTSRPSTSPTLRPTTLAPTPVPSKSPTVSAPSLAPTSSQPTASPTNRPTRSPTAQPTSLAPTFIPTKSPTAHPTSLAPTPKPTKSPTRHPTSFAPTPKPTKTPTLKPTTRAPTKKPSTRAPTRKPTKRPTSRPSHSPTCTKVPIADITWVLDKSSSVGANYVKVKSFVKDYVNKLALVGPKFTRVGLVEYNRGVKTMMALDDVAASDKTLLLRRIDELTTTVGGGTITFDALNKAKAMILATRRTGSRRVVILATDGMPTNSLGKATKKALTQTEQAARELKRDTNSTLVVIRIGKFDNTFLSSVADLKTSVGGFNALAGVLDRTQILCGGVAEPEEEEEEDVVDEEDEEVEEEKEEEQQGEEEEEQQEEEEDEEEEVEEEEEEEVEEEEVEEEEGEEEQQQQQEEEEQQEEEDEEEHEGDEIVEELTR